MIKFVAASMPTKKDFTHFFVSYRDFVFWIAYNYEDGSLCSGGFKPGLDVEDCLAAYGRNFDDMPKISDKFVEYISDDIKTKILSLFLKNKNKIDAQIEAYKEYVEELQENDL